MLGPPTPLWGLPATNTTMLLAFDHRRRRVVQISPRDNQKSYRHMPREHGSARTAERAASVIGIVPRLPRRAAELVGAERFGTLVAHYLSSFVAVFHRREIK